MPIFKYVSNSNGFSLLWGSMISGVFYAIGKDIQAIGTIEHTFLPSDARSDVTHN